MTLWPRGEEPFFSLDKVIYAMRARPPMCCTARRCLHDRHTLRIRFLLLLNSISDTLENRCESFGRRRLPYTRSTYILLHVLRRGHSRAYAAVAAREPLETAPRGRQITRRVCCVCVQYNIFDTYTAYNILYCTTAVRVYYYTVLVNNNFLSSSVIIVYWTLFEQTVNR